MVKVLTFAQSNPPSTQTNYKTTIPFTFRNFIAEIVNNGFNCSIIIHIFQNTIRFEWILSLVLWYQAQERVDKNGLQCFQLRSCNELSNPSYIGIRNN